MNRQGSETTGLSGWLPFLLIVAGTAVWANSLWGPFIYDDMDAIEKNEYIEHLWPPWHTMSAPPQSSVAGRPVISLSLAINYALGQCDVRGYHATNIAVHVLNALVLFGVVRQTLLSPPLRRRFGKSSQGLAVTCALLWMVHPIQSEPVNYVIQRTESIMGLFYLLTLYSAIRAHDPKHRLRWSTGSVMACALGMASKEVMVTAPLIVFGYDWAFRSAPFKHVLARRWILYVALAFTWVVLALLMVRGPRSASVGFLIGAAAPTYAMNQCLMIGQYLRLMVWPNPLVLDYGIPQPLMIWTVAPYAATLAALLIVTVVLLFRQRMMGFLGVWFFVILGPTSSFIPIVTEVGAERRMYLPSISVVIMAVISTYTALSYATSPGRFSRTATSSLSPNCVMRSICGACVILISSIFAWVDIHRNRDYRSAVSIWKTTVDARPNNSRAHNNLGHALQAAGDIHSGMVHFRKAINIDGDYAGPHYNLARAFETMGQPYSAIYHYRQALRVDPHYADARINLGSAYHDLGQLDQAVEQFVAALRTVPDDADVHYNLGVVLDAQGNSDEAMAHYRRALQSQPRHAESHNNLGILLILDGKADKAISHFRQALHIDLQYADAHENLADALASLARHSNRARRLKEAIDHFNSATTAYVAADQLARAAMVTRKSIQCAVAMRETELADELRRKLATYIRPQPNSPQTGEHKSLP